MAIHIISGFMVVLTGGYGIDGLVSYTESGSKTVTVITAAKFYNTKAAAKNAAARISKNTDIVRASTTVTVKPCTVTYAF